MVTLRLGHSLFAVLFLVPALGGLVACTFLAVALGSVPAAAVAALFAVVVLRLGWVLFRRSRPVPDETVVMGGLGGAAVTQPAFLTFARHAQGMWSQQGVVMVADHGGIFLPMGHAQHLLVDLVLTLIAPTVRFADVSFDLGGCSSEGMADAVRRHGGFVLGSDWTWNDVVRSLHREPSDGVVVLDHAPGERMGMYKPAPQPTAAEIRRSLGLVAIGGALGSAMLLGIGLAGAYLLDDLEFLVGFGAYAGMLQVAVVVAAVAIAKRRLG